MTILERLFGARLDPIDRRDRDPDLNRVRAESEAALRKVDAVLSPERRVAASIGHFGNAVRASRRERREH